MGRVSLGPKAETPRREKKGSVMYSVEDEESGLRVLCCIGHVMRLEQQSTRWLKSEDSKWSRSPSLEAGDESQSQQTPRKTLLDLEVRSWMGKWVCLISHVRCCVLIPSLSA